MSLKNETKVGILVTIVLLMLVVLTIQTGKLNWGKKGYTIKVQFKNVDGIDLNAPVMLNGLEVGLVKDIRISYSDDDTVMDLSVWLEEKAKIRSGAKAYVKMMGFMGEKYVGLTSGDKGAAYLAPGAVILGEEPVDFEKLLHDGQEIAAQIKDITTNLRERLEKNKDHIDSSLANLDTTMKNAVSITDNVDERLKVNKQNIDDIMANLKTAAVNLDQLTYDLKKHPWKIMYRSKEQRDHSLKTPDTHETSAASSPVDDKK